MTQTQTTPSELEQEYINSFLQQGIDEEAARRRAQAQIKANFEKNNERLPYPDAQAQERAWMIRRSPLRRRQQREELDRRRPLDCAVTGANLRARHEAEEAARKAADAVRRLWAERISRATALFDQGAAESVWQSVLNER